MKSRIFFIAVCTFFLTTSITFGYQINFTPSISVSEEYTDNYDLTERNKEHDYITIISPEFIAEILGKSSGAEISYYPSYAKYDKHDEDDAWRHRAAFSGWAELSRNTRLDVVDNFYYTEDPNPDYEADVTVPETPIDYTTRRRRETYYTNTARVNLLHQFGREDSFNLGFVYGFSKNDDPAYDDNTRYNPNVELTYWFATEWGLNIGGDYTKGEFDLSDDFDEWYGRVRLIKRFSRHLDGFVQYGHTSVEYDGNDEDFQVYNPSVGFDYSISRDTSCSFEMGYAILNNEESDDDSALSAIGSLTKTFQRGSINIIAESGYEGSWYGAENLGNTEFYELAGSATYQLTRHFSGNIFGSYRNSDYIELTPDREDKTTRAGLGMTMQALEWMALDLGYTYREVDSTLDTEEYDENRVFLRISLFPPRPFRTSR